MRAFLAEPMPPALEVDGLTKRYGDILALDEVSLTVDASECLTLLGPNGAGKTTLLECISTIRGPDEGRITVEGTPAHEDPMKARRSLGVAFQQPLASKHLTAREILIHHARLYGVPGTEARERARELLSFVGLQGRADDAVGGFSGGMERRLDLARVLMPRPRVLVLDEPTAGLDPRAKDEVHEKMEELIEAGRSVLVATHDLDEADRLADRVVVMDQGRVVASGRPGELARHVGRRVVEVGVGAEGVQRAREALERLQGARVVGEGRGVRAWLGEGGPSAGSVVEALEREGVPFEEIRVREPDLGDAFLGVTGRRFEEAREGAS